MMLLTLSMLNLMERFKVLREISTSDEAGIVTKWTRAVRTSYLVTAITERKFDLGKLKIYEDGWYSYWAC